MRERDDLFDGEQTREMGLLEDVDDPEAGALLMTAPVVRMSAAPGAIRFAGRRLGADTRALLAELGRSQEEIDALVAGGGAQLLGTRVSGGRAPRGCAGG